jgi:nucleotide-binding universal stress UspA family protein
MITKIAVGTDGSEPAMRAATWAVDLAKQLGASVVMIHVFTTDPARLPGAYVTLTELDWKALRGRYQEHLEGPWSSACVQLGVEHEALLVDGQDVARSLISAAQEKDCGLIVVGTHGASGLRELLLGSVSYHVVHLSPIPVVVVPNRT